MGVTKVQLVRKNHIYELLIYEDSSTTPLYIRCFSDAGKKENNLPALEKTREEGKNIAKENNIKLEEII